LLKLGTYRAGDPRSPGEGLRIGTVRYLPRGVKKEDYARENYFDVWFPLLAPSAELLRWIRSLGPDDDKNWAAFSRRYKAEMSKTDPRQAITLLAELSRTTSLSVGCFCVNESRCHRSLLLELIRQAAEQGPG
jgi:uncharacterized protein YeaO (DUF488 family)